MVAAVKYQPYIERLHEGEINWGSHTFKVALSNTLPAASSDDLADVTQIANGNGYTTGGTALSISSSAQTSGTHKVIAADVVFTASGSMGPFRYIHIYDDTHANDALCWSYDYGSSITLVSGETFTVDFDPTNGILQAT